MGVDELCDKMHGLIRVMICESGVLVFHLFCGEKERTLGEKVELLFSDFMKKFKLVKGEDEEEEAPRPQLMSTCPQTNLLGFIDSILEKMKSTCLHEAPDSVLVASAKKRVTIIYDGLAYLRSFLGNVMGQHDQNGKLQGLWSRVATVAYETEFVLDSRPVGEVHENFKILLDTITEEIELLKAEALGNSDNKGQIM
ncbi:OLC1v1005941C1 [Oldenlandia corymbosa var. corymbosa]|uniref:OLC1v1005941C1 n=1 Tax=Oldenlandia corymbosa var. corymbosa TaxID=529605 RepID=A0AAV1DJ68_OLDCO|nr:OLC1v1005941C1 [Oldenlandia corymbosa var. corymbosa]